MPVEREPIPIHRLAGDSSEAIMRAADAGAHLLVVPPGAAIDDASIDELRRGLDVDPMFGFAVPRDSAGNRWSAAIGSREALERASALLDAGGGWRFVPSVASGCALIRCSLVAELATELAGALTAGDLESFSIDANRLGYRTIVVDRALASIPASSARATSADISHLSTLHRLGAESRIERHVARLASVTSGRPSVVVDLSGFRALHNGTTECTKAILRGIVEAGAELDLVVACEPEIARFHHIAELVPAASVVPTDTRETFDIAIRVGIPFELSHVARVSELARTNVYMALDAIAWDCGHIRPRQLDAVWRLVAETADGLLFNSDFTAELFLRRFHEARGARSHVSPHSFDVRDYGAPETGATVDGPLLIVGNHFDHKFVAPTLERLLAALPHDRFVALGIAEHPSDRVRTIASGSLDDEQMRELYRSARAVIIPSHYEGFGFPIAHGLATGRPVFARDTELNRDFLERWHGPAALSLYRSTDELLAMLAAPPLERPALVREEPWNWARSGADIAAFLLETHAAFDAPRCTRRLARIAQLDAIATVAASRASAGSSPMTKVAGALRRVPGLRRVVRALRRR